MALNIVWDDEIQQPAQNNAAQSWDNLPGIVWDDEKPGNTAAQPFNYQAAGLVWDDEQPQAAPAANMITGGVEQNVRQEWDNKGRVHYVDNETGLEINNKLPVLERIGRNIKAFGNNAADWLNENNPASEAYQQKANLALAGATLPIGGIPALTKGIAGKLAPVIGRKIAGSIGTGASSGLLAGGIEGIGRGFIEGKNPLLTGTMDAALGFAGGGALGAAGGNLQSLAAGNRIKNTGNLENLTKPELQQFRRQARNYYKNYIQGTNTKSKIGNVGFHNSGIEELSWKNPKAMGELPTLKNNIKSARYNGNIEKAKHKNNARLEQFYELEGEKYNYLVGENPEGKKQYYYTQNKEAVPKLPQLAEGTTSNTSIITDNAGNVNPVGEMKSSRLARRMAKDGDLPTEVSKSLLETPPEYEVLHNADLKAQSQALINEDIRAVERDILNKVNEENKKYEFSALDFENARNIVDDLLNSGQTDAALDIISKVSEKASKAGQAVQALSLWAKTTPEGAIRQAQRIIDDYNKTARKKLSQINEQQANDIIELAQNIQMLPEGRAKDVATAQLMKYQTELVPVSGLQKVKTLRNISLLLNPKTFTRNIVGNGIFNLAETGSKALAAGIDNIAGKFTGKRTRVAPDIKTALQGFKQGAREGFGDAMLGIDTRRMGGRFDLPQARSFKGGIGGALEQALDLSLRVPDRAFYQAAFNESVQNQMRARGLKQVTDDILKTAETEAREAVFQNDGMMADIAVGARKLLNKPTDRIGMNQFGLGDLTVPFAQTPANIVEQGINYSPGGALKALKNAIQGNQRQATLDLARSAVGTGIIGAGYGLGKAGIAHGKLDPAERENLNANGIRDFSIDTPFGNVTYSQLQPMSALLSAGVALAGDDKKGAVNEALGSLMDMSMLQSLERFNTDMKQKGLTDASAALAGSYIGQGVPTGIAQINAYIDPVQRQTYDPNPLKRGLNQAAAKIPGVSKALPVKYDVAGRPVQKYESKGIQRAFDVFVNPVFVNKPKDDPVINELLELRSMYGENTLLPVAAKKVELRPGEQKILSGKEFSEYQRVLGENTYGAISMLMETPMYNNTADDIRIKLINETKKNARSVTEAELFGKDDKYNPKTKALQKVLNKYDPQRRVNNEVNKIYGKINRQILDDYFYGGNYDNL